MPSLPASVPHPLRLLRGSAQWQPTWPTLCMPNMVECRLCTSDISPSSSPAGGVAAESCLSMPRIRGRLQVGCRSAVKRCQTNPQGHAAASPAARRILGAASGVGSSGNRTFTPAVAAAERLSVAAAGVIDGGIAGSCSAGNAQLAGQSACRGQGRRSEQRTGRGATGRGLAGSPSNERRPDTTERRAIGRQPAYIVGRGRNGASCAALCPHLATGYLQSSPRPPPAGHSGRPCH